MVPDPLRRVKPCARARGGSPPHAKATDRVLGRKSTRLVDHRRRKEYNRFRWESLTAAFSLRFLLSTARRVFRRALFKPGAMQAADVKARREELGEWRAGEIGV